MFPQAGQTKLVNPPIDTRFLCIKAIPDSFTMHPPLYQAHPLCGERVEAFTKCHEDNPWMKFANVCGDLESAMNACFKEEKTLRRQLNREKGPVAFLKLVKKPDGDSSKERAADKQ